MTLQTPRKPHWAIRHWVSLVVGVLLLYTALPFLAPVLMKAGYTNAAQFIYKPYQGVCHTYGFRSFWLFGAQPVYPRGTPATPGDFERASGIDTQSFNGQLDARNFQGNEAMGYKVALCERDVAIYVSMALNGIAFGLVRRRVRNIPWWFLAAIGLGPIAFDGFSQLLSQAPFNLIMFRESTPFLRLLTGSLFGAAAAWFVFPLIQGTLD